MARQRARAPHRLLRLLLLLLGLTMLAAVGVMLAAQRFAARSEPTPLIAESTGGAVSDLPEDEIFRGQGFEFQHVIEGRPVFAIRADGIRQDRAEISHLENVRLELYRADASMVTVRSNEADYNQSNKDAKLVGQVHLEGSGLDLKTRTLLVSRDGQDLLSPTPAALRFDAENLVGRASTLRVVLDDELYILSGGVHLHTAAGAAVPMRLEAERLTHHRAEGIIRAIGRVKLERGGDALSAELLTLSFEDDMRTLKSLRARHSVVADVATHLELGADHIKIDGEGLILRFDPNTGLVRNLELEDDEANAQLSRVRADGQAQGFAGSHLMAQLSGGALRVIEGVGKPVSLTESIDMRDSPLILRQTCGERVEMRFSGGEPASLHLEGQVEVADTGVYASGGAVAEIDFARNTMRMSGTRVNLYHDDGEISAQAFIYQRDSHQIQAEGEVRALLEERAGRILAATPLGRGEGPIQVEAARATWELAPSRFVFTGGVRAWRDDNLILADQMRGDEDQQQIAASGSVETLWSPGVVPSPSAPRDLIRVTAHRMVYDHLHNALIYSDAVDAFQSGRRLRCKELVVDLASAGGTAERMTCSGAVTLEDLAAGRRIEGERAVYTLSDERIEVNGAPVTVHEADGSTLVCRFFRYDTETGAIEVRSSPPPPAAPEAEVPAGAVGESATESGARR